MKDDKPLVFSSRLSEVFGSFRSAVSGDDVWEPELQSALVAIFAAWYTHCSKPIFIADISEWFGQAMSSTVQHCVPNIIPNIRSEQSVFPPEHICVTGQFERVAARITNPKHKLAVEWGVAGRVT